MRIHVYSLYLVLRAQFIQTHTVKELVNAKVSMVSRLQVLIALISPALTNPQTIYPISITTQPQYSIDLSNVASLLQLVIRTVRLNLRKETCVCVGALHPGVWGELNKVLFGEVPPRGPNPYPFIYHF